MGRPRREILYSGALAHITWRTNNKEFLLTDPAVKKFLYETLVKYKKKYNLKIFDWVVMSNHLHFTAFVDDIDKLSKFMQSVNSVVAKFINKRIGRTGTVVADRFKSPVIECENYFVNTTKYIWLNPARAKILKFKNSKNYPWSSLYKRYRGIPDPLVDSYSELKDLLGIDLLEGCRNVQDFVKRLISTAINERFNGDSELFEHSHSLGSEEFQTARRNRRSFLIETSTWFSNIGPAPPLRQ